MTKISVKVRIRGTHVTWSIKKPGGMKTGGKYFPTR